MRDTAGQPPDRLQLLGLKKRLPRSRQRFLGSLSFRHIPGDLRKTQQLAFLILDGVNNHVSPESSAVLANPPPFALVPTLSFGDSKDLLWPARRPVLFRVEPGKMLPDDFAFRIALQPRAADVPVGYDACGVEHIDCVISDALHEQPETLLAAQAVPCAGRSQPEMKL